MSRLFQPTARDLRHAQKLDVIAHVIGEVDILDRDIADAFQLHMVEGHFGAEGDGGQQAELVARINPPDIEIGEHLTVNGIAGCNRYFGQGHLEDDRLWVTSLGNTEMACLAPLDAVEQAVLTTLTEGATLSGTPQTLILTGKQHRLEYKLRDWVY